MKPSLFPIWSYVGFVCMCGVCMCGVCMCGVCMWCVKEFIKTSNTRQPLKHFFPHIGMKVLTALINFPAFLAIPFSSVKSIIVAPLRIKMWLDFKIALN